MSAVLIFILWTWKLTPLWVNIVATCILGIKILVNVYNGAEERSRNE